MSLLTTAKLALTRFTDWLLPQNCFLCGARSQQVLCEECLADLSVPTTVCSRCARELPINSLCGHCQRSPPPYTQIKALFAYEYPVDQLIIAAKFNQKLAVLNYLGDQMAKFLSTQLTENPPPDVLIPVPLHWNRLRQRGYNQSVELAKRIHKHTKIPLDYLAVKRVRDTPPQTQATNRQENIKSTDFRVTRLNPQWQYVALIDDVVTTGTTVTAVSQVLLDAKIQRVDVWCCARTSS